MSSREVGEYPFSLPVNMWLIDLGYISVTITRVRGSGEVSAMYFLPWPPIKRKQGVELLTKTLSLYLLKRSSLLLFPLLLSELIT